MSAFAGPGALGDVTTSAVERPSLLHRTGSDLTASGLRQRGAMERLHLGFSSQQHLLPPPHLATEGGSTHLSPAEERSRSPRCSPFGRRPLTLETSPVRKSSCTSPSSPAHQASAPPPPLSVAGAGAMGQGSRAELEGAAGRIQRRFRRNSDDCVIRARNKVTHPSCGAAPADSGSTNGGSVVTSPRSRHHSGADGGAAGGGGPGGATNLRVAQQGHKWASSSEKNLAIRMQSMAEELADAISMQEMKTRPKRLCFFSALPRPLARRAKASIDAHSGLVNTTLPTAYQLTLAAKHVGAALKICVP